MIPVPWTQSYLGKCVTGLCLEPDQVDLESIAHQLALINRWCGASRIPISVAEHSVRVAQYLVETVRSEHWLDVARAGLFHDAAETIFSDVAHPYKATEHMAEYREMEDRALEVIFGKFGIPWPIPAEVHYADRVIRATERAHLLATADEDVPDEPLPLDEADGLGWSWQDAEREFIAMYDFLYRDEL